MSDERKNRDNRNMQEIIEQYKESMRTLIKQGKLNHRELEKHLTDVMNQMSQEVQKTTAELLKEADAKEEKKTVPARDVDKKQE